MYEHDPSRIVSGQDQVDILRAHGYDRLLQELEDQQHFTKRGRLNLTSISRALGVSPQTVKNWMEQCRQLLDT